MKFGTLIEVTNTSIFRYSAKVDVQWFPWKQQFFKIHEIPPFTLVYQQIILFQWFQLVYQIRFVLVYGTLPLTICYHGNQKLESHLRTEIKALRLFDGPVVSWSNMCDKTYRYFRFSLISVSQ